MSERTTISRSDFIPAYVEGVKAGKTAAQIGEPFGLSAKQVTAKACQLRKLLKTKAEALAVSKGLTAEQTAEFVTQAVSKVPLLENRSTLSILDEFGVTLPDTE